MDDSAILAHMIAQTFDHASHFIFPDEVVQQQAAHPLLQGLHVTRAGKFMPATPFVTARPQGLTDSHVVIYCTDGVGWLQQAGVRWTIRAGDMLFVLQGEPHEYGSDVDDPWQISWAHFAGSEVAAMLALLDVTASQPIRNVGLQPQLIGRFDEIFQHCQLGYSPFVLIEIAAILRRILSSVALRHAFVQRRENGLDAAVVIATMQDRVAENLTVPQLAATVGLSESHFSRLFRRQTGYAPLDYFIRLKMQRACDFLYATDMPVQEIGRKLGYLDPHYFSRRFKQTIGVSPTKFRAQLAAERKPPAAGTLIL